MHVHRACRLLEDHRSLPSLKSMDSFVLLSLSCCACASALTAEPLSLTPRQLTTRASRAWQQGRAHLRQLLALAPQVLVAHGGQQRMPHRVPLRHRQDI